MANIILFHFEQSEVRYVGDGTNHEWVAQDVFEAMGLKWNSDLIAAYDETEAGTTSIGVRSENGVWQEREVRTLKTPGLYTAMLRCRAAMKPGTLPYRFRKWVTGDVINSIEKTGSYSLNQDKAKLERQFLPTPTAKSLKEFHGLHKLMYGKAYADRWLAAKIKEYYPEHVGIAPVPEELPSLPSKALLTPTEVAVELGVFCKSSPEKGDARWVNKKLEELGYQEKISGQWSATSKADGLCDRKPVDTNSRTQKDQLKWSVDIIPVLQEHALSR